VWTLLSRENLAPAGIRTPTVQPVAIQTAVLTPDDLDDDDDDK
jgi:hypothetical protein